MSALSSWLYLCFDVFPYWTLIRFVHAHCVPYRYFSFYSLSLFLFASVNCFGFKWFLFILSFSTDNRFVLFYFTFLTMALFSQQSNRNETPIKLVSEMAVSGAGTPNNLSNANVIRSKDEFNISFHFIWIWMWWHRHCRHGYYRCHHRRRRHCRSIW